MSESKRRSVVKAVSWRVFATLITTGVVYVMTGKFEFAAKVGIVDTLIKIFVYFAHERMWLKIDYGKLPPRPDYEI